MKYLLFLFTLCLSQDFQAQFGFEFNPSIPVIVNGAELKHAWSGGVNYGQYSPLDYNNDGLLDLLVFDRSKDQLKVFLTVEDNGDFDYQYIYKADTSFPSGVRYRVQTFDYDQDGDYDLFTYGIGGVQVYKNVSVPNNPIAWELLSPLLYSQYENTYANLYVSSSDIPALVDVDNDGDMDVLTFQISGTHLEYHQNQSQELYGHSDSLVFELRNKCWGKFSEDPNNSQIILNDNGSACNSGNVPNPEKPREGKGGIHTGSTVLALDMNNNGVKELLLGDIANPSITLLINGGTTVNSDSEMISFDADFPSNSSPAIMDGFPAPFYLDVDFDGIKDLIVAPNAKNVSQNEKSALYYKNTGSNSAPQFEYQQNDFLQDQTIDHGSASIPVLFDQNNDGLLDLIVANFFQYDSPGEKKSNLALYRNTGTINDPIFTLIDEDYLNLSSTGYKTHNIPTFGDLTNNGKEDVILALENGNFAYYQNTSTTGNASFSAPIIPLKDNANNDINHGSLSSPQLFDLNQDGLMDLIVGRRTGELVYYQNIGTQTAPEFELKNDHLGYVDVSTATSPDGFATPHFFTINQTIHLFVGALDGRMRNYSNIIDHLHVDSSFVLANDSLLGLNTGGYSSFVVSELNNNNKVDLLVGGDQGGLWLFEVDPNSNIGLEENKLPRFELWPNPSSGGFNLRLSSEAIESLSIFDLQGRKIIPSIVDYGDYFYIDMGISSKGLYLVSCPGFTNQKVWIR